ncbi:DUF2341 domain-containing protein [Oceanispirochaeta sp.]|uniref:DUF2341 domain-containing protein n=1 Tax=Oceanispirochaeta sp. TaxID=2035350 RepID=UPI002610E75C|nr:DUF2341 domain-containing protein [Oceanispirochaeta sp.]MDA3958623.1 DUF2341 domain-containing protein [Oceanispirochaeta sp.]
MFKIFLHYVFFLVVFILLAACSDPGAWDLLNQVDAALSDSPLDTDAPIQTPLTGEGWRNRKKLTINHASSTETLSDFPIMVVLNSSRINYGQLKTDGSDLAFFSSDLLSEYAYEIDDTWNSGGETILWVKIPSLPAGGSTGIWMYYGNDTETGLLDSSQVWNSDYQAVWHLNAPSPQYTDSSGKGHHGLSNPPTNPTSIPGFIGDGASFDNGPDRIAVTTTPAISNLGPVTYTGWFFNTGVSGDNLFSKGALRVYGNSSDSHVKLEYAKSIIISPISYEEEEGLLTASHWVFLAITWDGAQTVATTLLSYKDGNQYVGSIIVSNGAGTINSDAPDDFYLGYSGAVLEESLLHTMDEFRISNVIRSDDWIKIQYLSQTDSLLIYGLAEVLE